MKKYLFKYLIALILVVCGIKVYAVQRPKTEKGVQSSVSAKARQTSLPPLSLRNHRSPAALATRKSREIQGPTEVLQTSSSLSPQNESSRVRDKAAETKKSLRFVQETIHGTESPSCRPLPSDEKESGTFAQQMQPCNRTSGRVAEIVLTGSPVPEKMERFCHAIALAEGFGLKGALPTRYHNPGDLKSRRDLAKLPGQKRLGKGDHVVFTSDAAGWAALQDYIRKMVDGRSRRFRPNMTIKQVACVYAGNWRPWVKIVTTELGVTPTTTLAELLTPDSTEPPTVVMVQTPVMGLVLVSQQPAIPVLAQD